MSKTPKISLKGVSKGFGGKVVLDGLDLDIMRGESVVVIGGSGTGKSVMVKCILGLLDVDGGQILIDGKDMTNAPAKIRGEFLKHIGMLFQASALFDSLTVLDNVAFGLVAAKKMDRKDAAKIALSKLERVGLPGEVAGLYPEELSGGMKKRVGLARAIAGDPDIIFFDEPTTGLDPIMADVINDLIVECVRDLGATTLAITHDMSSVRKIADKAAMLYGGKIIWHGSQKDMAGTKNPYLKQFITGSAHGPIKPFGMSRG
ncbi:MAG TPA: ATP-binding cassette domain-containing protein [Sphingomonadales bacterium]|nr:ATP-binding cassette domain-containing protein [Sphingomonadales bacterium]